MGDRNYKPLATCIATYLLLFGTSNVPRSRMRPSGVSMYKMGFRVSSLSMLPSAEPATGLKNPGRTKITCFAARFAAFLTISTAPSFFNTTAKQIEHGRTIRRKTYQRMAKARNRPWQCVAPEKSAFLRMTVFAGVHSPVHNKNNHSAFWGYRTSCSRFDSSVSIFSSFFSCRAAILSQ